MKNFFSFFFSVSCLQSLLSDFLIQHKRNVPIIYFQNTGSQESIIELDLDDDDRSDTSPSDQRRRYSVSPMPQIRSSESQVRNQSFHMKPF